MGMDPNTPPAPDRLSELLHDHYRETLGAGATPSDDLDARILAALQHQANNDQR